MQILAISLLLIECTLILSVYGDCFPFNSQCIDCESIAPADACVLSADNTTLECQLPYPSNMCTLKTCASVLDTCLVWWFRSNEAAPWTITSGCVTIDAFDNPCNYDGTCEERFDTPSDPIPITLATGTFSCRCYEDYCNQNFSVDISTDEHPVTTSITLTPTPTPEIDERDCVKCDDIELNCTLSEDNRILECSIDDECANNIIQCNEMETCATTVTRQDGSSPWRVSGGCLGGRSGFARNPQPTCEVNEFFFKEGTFKGPIPDSVETGSFICGCMGGPCNREFRIDLNNLTSSETTTTTMSPTPSTGPVNFSTTRTFTMIPTPSTNNSGGTTSGGTTRVGQTSDVNTDGKFICKIQVVWLVTVRLCTVI